MGLVGDILKQVNGAVESLTNIFGGGNNGKMYPSNLGGLDTKAITNVIDNYANADWRSSRGYSFKVVRVSRNGSSEVSKDAEGWKEFRLQINPQELTQDEIFAIEVTPTLRGVLVEHHGTILKDISMSGTTGVSPMRREGGATLAAGLPILQSGHSGFQEFHELRSYIRAYVEAKRIDGATNGELRMIFKNYKDQEYLYIEPQKFTMKRSSARPFLYDYNFSFKGVGVADKPEAAVKGWLDKLDDALETADEYLQLAEGIINGSIGLIRRVESDIFNKILNPIRTLNRAINAVRGGQALLFGEFGVTRRFCEDLKRELERVEANWADAIGKSSPDYDKASGRTPTTVASSGRRPTNTELEVANAWAKAKKATILVLGQSEQLFQKNTFEVNQDVAAQFGDGTLIQLDEPSSVKEINILDTDDLQSIAARELGEVDKFRDIILLNNLKPPYIDPAGGPGVLKPGDKILLPSFNPSTTTDVIKSKEFQITKNMREAEKNLGVDIRLTKDGDLAQSNTGDFDLLGGMDNMSQAVSLRLAYEKGSLKRHLTIGTNLQTGRKVRSNSLNEMRDDVIASFLQDTRVESVPFVEIIQEGNTTFMNILLKLKESNQPIPIPIQIQTG